MLPLTPFAAAPVTLPWVKAGISGLREVTAEPTSGHLEATIGVQAPVGGPLAIRAQHAAFRIEKLVAYGTGRHCS